jgi:hypothetical protein
MIVKKADAHDVAQREGGGGGVGGGRVRQEKRLDLFLSPNRP